MLKFVVKKVILKPEVVRCMIKRHLHVETLLSNIQTPWLPVCQGRHLLIEKQKHLSSRVTFSTTNTQKVYLFTYKVCRQGFLVVVNIHMLQMQMKK